MYFSYNQFYTNFYGMNGSIIWENFSTLCIRYTSNFQKIMLSGSILVLYICLFLNRPSILVAKKMYFGRMVNEKLYQHTNNPQKILFHGINLGKLIMKQKFLFTFKFQNYPRKRTVANYFKNFAQVLKKHTKFSQLAYGERNLWLYVSDRT